MPSAAPDAVAKGVAVTNFPMTIADLPGGHSRVVAIEAGIPVAL